MIFEAVELVRHFGSIKAVDGVSLQVEEGEISSIIGPNGAGKSTLFDLITNKQRCDKGKVFFKGEDITNFPAHKIISKGIGRSFQICSVLRRLTVFENIQVGFFPRHGDNFNMFFPASRKWRNEVFEILESIGLAERADFVAGNLSYGDQKRLELGIVLATNPELLFLDEPTAGVSPAEARGIMGLIRSLGQEKGLSVVFIEHDMNVVLNFSDKIRVMAQGKMIAEGTPEEVKNNPEVKRVYLGEE